MKNKILIGLLLTATIFAASCGDKNFSITNSKKITQEEGDLNINYSLGDLIKVGKYKGIDLHKAAVVIDDKQIIGKMMSLAGEFKDKKFTTDENEAVGNGDIVNIDFEGFVDGSDKSLDSTTAKEFVLGIGSGSFIEGFEAQLIGHKVGEPKFDINVKFPENYGEPSMAGKPARFEIKINGIVRDKDVAANNDKTQSKTVAEWKEVIKAELIKEADENAKFGLADEAMSRIAKLSQVRRFPKNLIEKYKQIRIDELYKPYAEQMGMTFEEFMEEYGITDATLEQEAQNDLFKEMIVIRIAQKEKITVTAEEVLEAKQKKKQEEQMKPVEEKKTEEKQETDNKADADDKASVDDETSMNNEIHVDEELTQALLYDKVIDFIIENANIITVDKEDYNKLMKEEAAEEEAVGEDEVVAEEVDETEAETEN